MYKNFREDKKEEKSEVDSLTFSNLVSIQALMNLLVKKGIVTKEEIIQETNFVKSRWDMTKKNSD